VKEDSIDPDARFLPHQVAGVSGLGDLEYTIQIHECLMDPIIRLLGTAVVLIHKNEAVCDERVVTFGPARKKKGSSGKVSFDKEERI